jgi:hypothetical protein
MNKNSLNDEQLNTASGGADITLNDTQQAQIRDEFERLRAENLDLKKRAARAEVLVDIYETNKDAKKDSTTMTQIGRDVGVIN